MSTTIDLKEVERKAWRSVFQDGMWDIYLGLFLLAMATSALMTDSGIAEEVNTPIFIGLTVVAMAILWAGKQFITIPRVGRVQFGEKRKSHLNWIRLFLGLSVVLGFVFWALVPVLQGVPISPNIFFPALWSLNCIVLFGLGAHLLDFSRLYVIGVLYAIAIPAHELLARLISPALSYLAFGLPGLSIVVMGSIVLMRFLRDYPALDMSGEVSDGARQ